MRVLISRFLVTAMCVTTLVLWQCSAAIAQTGSGGGSPSAESTGGAGGGSTSPGALPGGGAQADFATLMNLIQQTIDPDDWLATGGVNTILPYPNGVYIDPAGHMKRAREAGQFSVDLLGSSNRPQHPWRTDSQLRTVSLKQLDQALRNAALMGLRPTAELQKLAGLSKISYVKIDVAGEDVLIAGPALHSDASGQALGFELQDLAVVAALIGSNTQPLGCSIEPSDAGILEAQQMLQQPGAIKRLARNPRMVVEQMQEKIGAHNVRVFGMDANTGTAVALIDADVHMKRVGFGTAATRERVNSYFDHLDQQKDVPAQSLIRWWFAYADEPILAGASRDMFQLPEQCVAVMSEQQWVSQQGRAPTGGNDPAADAFAAGMTKHLPGLRQTDSSYARLCAVFELGLALQLAVESTGQPSLDAWFPNLCALGSAASPENPEPKTVEGLTAWHKLKNGTIVAVVSGGVKIDVASLAASDKWKTSKFLAKSIVPEQSETPSTAHGSWWWDQR